MSRLDILTHVLNRSDCSRRGSWSCRPDCSGSWSCRPDCSRPRPNFSSCSNPWKSELPTSFSVWPGPLRWVISLLANMSRCKVCPMQSLCCADLALHASHQDPLDVVVVELGAWYLYSTAVQYSTVQYRPLYFLLLVPGHFQALPSSSIERHSIF